MSAAPHEPAAAIEQEKAERQQMAVDIACVGFGPATAKLTAINNNPRPTCN